MLEFDEAIKRILKPIKSKGVEKVNLLDAAGRILGQEIRADSDVPFNDNSAMDGYAVLASDVKNASEENPVSLEVIDEIPAGKAPEKPITAGNAARIFTGAPMPPGADAVVMQEFTDSGGGAVFVKAPVAVEANVRRAGEDIKKGQLVFEPGKRLKAADIGVIASAGYAEFEVGRRPVVGIVSTGNEVIGPDAPPAPGKVRNSNSYSLCAKCVEIGAVPKFLDTIPDERALLEEGFRKAAAQCDLIIASGGVSVGDYDLVTDVLRDIGTVDFWKIKMKPGKPLAYGSISGTPFLGLPGNPVSVMVGFELFVRPVIMKMMGASSVFRPRATAVMEHDHREKPARMKILRGIAVYSGDGTTVSTTGMQGSGILMSMVLSNCFIVIPEGVDIVKKGDTVEIISLDREGV